jgi:cytochrome c5
MNKKFLFATFSLLGIALVAGSVSAIAGGGAVTAPTSTTDSSTDGIDGAKLWAETCSQCHNMRPVKAYSKAEWGVIVHHMRIRANLTGKEARAIANFLQSSEN